MAEVTRCSIADEDASGSSTDDASVVGPSSPTTSCIDCET